jgi:hypothetical protein
MQVEPKNNYNLLGRMGPLQPRAEYRPGKPKEESAKTGDGAGERSPERLAPRKVLGGTSGEGRLSLQAAKALTAATAEAIESLDPGSRKGPHSDLAGQVGLMSPRYV